MGGATNVAMRKVSSYRLADQVWTYTSNSRTSPDRAVDKLIPGQYWCQAAGAAPVASHRALFRAISFHSHRRR